MNVVCLQTLIGAFLPCDPGLVGIPAFGWVRDGVAWLRRRQRDGRQATARACSRRLWRNSPGRYSAARRTEPREVSRGIEKLQHYTTVKRGNVTEHVAVAANGANSSSADRCRVPCTADIIIRDQWQSGSYRVKTECTERIKCWNNLGRHCNIHGRNGSTRISWSKCISDGANSSGADSCRVPCTGIAISGSRR